MTTIVQVRCVVPSCDTTAEGEVIGANLHVALATDAEVIISFKDRPTVTTNFVAASFCSLLDDYELDEIKRRVSIVDSTRQINDMIKWMMGAR